MAIARTQNVSANAASVAITSTASGDIIVVFAYNTTTTIPSLPGGFTNIAGTAGTQQAARCGYLISSGGDTSSGTWTNATQVLCMVYSEASGIGATSVINPGSSTTPTWLSTTSTVAAGYMISFAGGKSATSGFATGTLGSANGYVWTVRTNLTTASAQDSSIPGSGLTTGGGGIVVSPTTRWQTICVEVKEAPPVAIPLPELIKQPLMPVRFIG